MSLNGKIYDSGLSDRPNLDNDDLMSHMDDKMKRSYNGFRNAEMILNSVITKKDKETNNINKKIGNFRNFLRCVKKFGKTNGISENKMGYLGGISFALMCVKI